MTLSFSNEDPAQTAEEMLGTVDSLSRLHTLEHEVSEILKREKYADIHGKLPERLEQRVRRLDDRLAQVEYEISRLRAYCDELHTGLTELTPQHTVAEVLETPEQGDSDEEPSAA